jgi:stress response protein YsnF/sporulation protein YlmC with PRC-barrel domain
VEHTQLGWRGQTAYASDGEKIGKIEEIYLDLETGQPEWALVHTGMFGTSSSFVPLAQATDTGDGIRFPYPKAMVKDAPRLDGGRELSPAEERDLYAYYGVAGYDEVATAPTAQAGQTGSDTSGPTTDDAMTRSEEELLVGTATREVGRARLRKHIVSEPVTASVPVTRESARVVREPITEANVDRALDGPELSEEEHEVVLTEQVPVVEKRTVPKERVRLETEQTTDEVTIQEEVRQEVIEVDEPTDLRR